MGKQKSRPHVGMDGRTLTPIEEKVLRMRHGIKARGFTRLEKSGDGHPAAAEHLARLEQRLLAAQQTQGHPLCTVPAGCDPRKS